MKLMVFLSSMLVASSTLAASIGGTYKCDDGGLLSVKQSSRLGTYYASLEYNDGSSSTLAEFQFRGESLRGQMLRDDEDAFMGRVIKASQGQKLVLQFSSGEVVNCLK